MTKRYPSKADAFKAVCDDFRIPIRSFVIDNLVGLWNKNMLLATIYPETVDTLKQLKDKGIKLAIISNSPEQNIEPVLEKFDLNKFFDVILLSFEEGMIKADSALYEKAVDMLGLEKEDVIVVGDSIKSDMDCAKKAGLKNILIDRKNNREFEDKITDLSQLLELD